MKLRITKSSVKNIGKEISSDGKQLEIINRKINAIVEDLALNWEGPDCEKIVTQVRDIYIVNLNQLSNQIKGYGEYLQNINRAYDQLDDSYSSKKIGK